MNLLDTTVVLELLESRKYRAGSISIVTILEILRGLEAGKREKVKELLEESFQVLALDNEVVKTYCSLYRKLKDVGSQVPDADLLIAATAMSHDMTIETRDEHFKRLEALGLKLAKP